METRPTYIEIESLMKKEKDRRMFERYQTIYLHLKGKNTLEISEIIGRTERTVYKYLRAYREAGVVGLQMNYSTGAPERLTKEQQEQLKQTIVSSVPHEVGFLSKYSWTLYLIGEYIQREFGPTYSLRGISKMVHRLGLSYTKPTYTLAAADEVKQQAFTEVTFPTLKKLMDEEIAHLLFEDESMIRDYQALQHTWFLKGKQRVIQTTGKHRGVKLLAVLNYATGHILWKEDEQYDAVTFLSFLQSVIEAYPQGRMVMVLDNARIHHAKLLQPFLEKHKERLELVFLPPYSPKLNLVEGLWKWLKADVINNVFFHSVTEICKKVTAFMKNIALDAQTIIDRLCLRLETNQLPEQF
ncbi:IS630 family transposase [Paenibacillus sp. FSL H8-0034]